MNLPESTCLHLRESAIDLEVRAVDVTGVIERKERHHVGDFRGLRIPTERHLSSEVLVEALQIGTLTRKPIEPWVTDSGGSLTFRRSP